MRAKTSQVIKNLTSNLKNYSFDILDIIKKPEMSLLPGQLSWFLLLSLVPILTFTGYLLSVLDLNTNYIIDLLNEVIPGGSSYLITSFQTFSREITFMDIILFIWMFYIATNGCNTIILVSNQIYGINKSNWLKRRFKAIFMTLYIILLIVFLIISPIFIDSLFDLFDRIIVWDGIYQLISTLKTPVLFFLVYVFLRVFYNFAPDRVRDRTHLRIGALFTTTGWFIVTAIYKYSSTNMSNYETFYGALANVAIIMVWLYFISYVFVLGLVLNYGAEEKEKTIEKTGAIKVIKGR